MTGIHVCRTDNDGIAFVQKPRLTPIENVDGFINIVLLFHMHPYVIAFCFTLCLHRSNAEESYSLAKNQQNWNSTTTEASRPDLSLYLGIYGGFVIGLFLLCLFSTELFYTLTIVASRNLYDKMLSSLMRAPMYFFDNNSIGK